MAEAWDTARIREAFIYDGGEAEYHDPEHGAQTQRQVAGEIFDRWLAAHDAEKDRLAEAVQAAYNALHMETRERAIAILHDALSGVVAEEPQIPTSMKRFHGLIPGMLPLFHTYCSEHPDFGTCEEEVQAHRDIADHLASEHYEVKQEEAEDVHE